MSFWIRDETVIAQLEELAKRKGVSMEQALFEAARNQLAVIELGDKLRREMKKLTARHRRVLAAQRRSKPSRPRKLK